MIKRTLAVLAFLVVSGLLLPSAHAAGGEVVSIFVRHEDQSLVSASIDLVDNPENLTVEAEANKKMTGAQLVLRHACTSSTCTEIRVSMTGADVGGGTTHVNWTAPVNLTDLRIVKGDWSVTVHVFDADGTVASKARATPLTFTANDTTPPALALVGGGTSVELGGSDSIRFTVTDATLQRATYQIAGMPSEAVFPHPYTIPESSFAQGTQTVTVRAYDRAGLSSSLVVTVSKDTVTPTLTAVFPADVFAHVPAKVTVVASDASPFELQVSFDGTVQRASKAAGTSSTVFDVVTNRTGNVTVAISAVDSYGNIGFTTQTFNVSTAQTDGWLKSVNITSPRLAPLGGETVTFSIATAQKSGDATLPFRLDWMFSGQDAENTTLSIPLGADNVHNLQRAFAPGLHVLEVNLTTPMYANETDGTNQNRTLAFEVFMGRVTHLGTTHYHIRAGDNGLPTVAVGPDGQTYPVRFDEDSADTRYLFTVGETELHWDPVEGVTFIGEPGPQGKKSPGLGAVGLLGLVGAAAFVARRRA